ncbi:MAG: glycosyltransferase family 2 protein [bacterium]
MKPETKKLKVLSYKLVEDQKLDEFGRIKPEFKFSLTYPEFRIKDSKFVGKPEDNFETKLFLPEGEGRKQEGGLRTKGYFKFSYKLKNGIWHICDLDGNPVKPAPECIQSRILTYLDRLPNKEYIDELPLISVITVVLNVERYLEETIQSVINQTYPNLEYIIVDGGSVDGTLDILKKYENYIDYWISEKDRGIYDAMNKGIMLSLGKGRIFLNAGDYFVGNIFNPPIQIPSYIPVKFIRLGKLTCAKLKSPRLGLPYCHQGILFDRDNQFLYDIRFKFAADYVYFLDKYSFNHEIKYVNEDSSYVYYDNFGFSARNFIERDKEIAYIIFNRSGLFYFLIFTFLSLNKALAKIVIRLVKSIIKNTRWVGN